MDDETRIHLDGMLAQINARFDATMALINDQSERLLEGLGVQRDDLRNTKGFLLDDALVLGRRVSSIEDRLDKLEKKLPE